MTETPNPDQVICPNCAHQFRAIPVNVQKDLAEKWQAKRDLQAKLWVEQAAREEWKARAEAAEQALALRGEPMKKEPNPNNDPVMMNIAKEVAALRGEPVAKEKIRAIAWQCWQNMTLGDFSADDIEAAIHAGIALYAAPISGERVADKDEIIKHADKLERDSERLEWLIEQGYQVWREKAGYTVRTVIESDALFNGQFKDARDAIDSAMREAR